MEVFTKRDRKRIKKMYEEGSSITDILNTLDSKEFEILSHILKSEGLEIKRGYIPTLKLGPKKRRILPLIKQLKEEIKELGTARKVAEKYEVTEGAISHCLSRYEKKKRKPLKELKGEEEIVETLKRRLEKDGEREIKISTISK